MKRRVETSRRTEVMWSAVVAAVILLMLTPSSAAAYLGPGGGLSLLATAAAMLGAFSVSAVVVLTWPVRAFRGWLKRRREKRLTREKRSDEHPQK